MNRNPTNTSPLNNNNISVNNYTQNGKSVHNPLYNSHDIRIEQYKASLNLNGKKIKILSLFHDFSSVKLTFDVDFRL